MVRGLSGSSYFDEGFKPENLHHRDDALLCIAYVMLIFLFLSQLTGGTAVCGHS